MPEAGADCAGRGAASLPVAERSHVVGAWGARGAVEVNNRSTVEQGGRASGSRENKLPFEVGYLWLKRRGKMSSGKGNACVSVMGMF